jgi:hypothetical protein
MWIEMFIDAMQLLLLLLKSLLATCSPLHVQSANRCGVHLLKQVGEWDTMSGVDLGITLRGTKLHQAVLDVILSNSGALLSSKRH